jgi:hypothetical protein
MDNFNIDELAHKISKDLQSVDLFPEDEIKEAVKDAKLDFNKEYDKPIPLIQMIEDHRSYKDVLTTANISTTIGGAKSKKTFFATMLIASLLGYKDFAINGNLQGLNVVLFDTEQALYHVQKISNRLKTMLKGSLNNIEIFALRAYMPEKRAAMIEYYLKQQQGNYSFVIIDGAVDLLYDFNDLKESKQISTKFMEWSANYNCHINTILHTNKDQNYARGHLGSELMNKSETVFRITKEDDNISSVNCEMSRNAGFKAFQFNIDKGLPNRLDYPFGFYDNEPGEHKPLEQLIKNDEGLNNNTGFSESSDIPF